ncbi:MAG TPA: type II secretion system protein [Actinomycetota bacterium]|nr:type II secretion system protein [Actinomycetota bacterium]
MTRWLASARSERGFTLIEMSFAVGVFGIALLGLSFVFRSAFTTVSVVRVGQLAKTLAQEKLEEVRSLPFYVSQKEETTDVDLLDRYFPDDQSVTTPTGAAGTYDSTSGTWTFTSRDSIDPANAPAFTRDVVVRFVVPGTLQPQAPIAGYSSDVADADMPATDAVRVTVTVSWASRGEARSVSLDTVIARVRREGPEVEASGSALGAQVSGVTFQDGSTPAAVVALLADTAVAFREVTESSSQASADAVEAEETDPVTNVPLQDPAPSGDESASTAPNSTTGNEQTGSAPLVGGSLASVNDTEPVVIAAWGSRTAAASTQARVSSAHTLNPESHAQAVADDVLVNARDAGQPLPHAVVEFGAVASTVEERSTELSTSVAASVDVSPFGDDPGVTVWAAPQLAGDEDFRGVLIISSLHVDVESEASSATSDTIVNWEVQGLQVWDPELQTDEDAGGYTAPVSFGMVAGCGGWVGDPSLCGPTRTDGKSQFENPNPVVLPPAYVGDDGESVSLSIVAGVTIEDAEADAAAGISSASAAQKNVLTITTRDDVAGTMPLEPMLLGIGSVATNSSYVSHEH